LTGRSVIESARRKGGARTGGLKACPACSNSLVTRNRGIGTIHSGSTDKKATLPANYTFTAADKGVHTFSGLVLRTKGYQKITITDTPNSSLWGSVIVDVLSPFGRGSKAHMSSTRGALAEHLSLTSGEEALEVEAAWRYTSAMRPSLSTRCCR
jgi:hypothetical protein